MSKPPSQQPRADKIPALPPVSPLVNPMSAIPTAMTLSSKEFHEAVIKALENRNKDLRPYKNGKSFSPEKGSLTHSLSEYDSGFPSQIRAKRIMWACDPQSLPYGLAILDTQRREELIAAYPADLYLTIKYYPDMLDAGYMFLTLTKTPGYATSYPHEKIITRPDLPVFDFSYDTIEHRPDMAQKGYAPLFILLDALETDHMTDDINQLKEFRALQNDVGDDVFKLLGFIR